MGPDEPSSLLQGFTMVGIGLAGFAVVFWGRRGAIGAYLAGLGLCLLGWGLSVTLVTRLGGDRADPVLPALAANAGVLLTLVVYWLVVASGGILIGATARALLHRYRQRNPGRR
jgi:hypothetical protein